MLNAKTEIPVSKKKNKTLACFSQPTVAVLMYRWMQLEATLDTEIELKAGKSNNLASDHSATTMLYNIITQ